MDESILQSIKDLLGGQVYEEGDITFDAEIVPLINSALNTLVQIGVGPSQGYNIKNGNNVWSEFVGDDEMLLNMVKEYCYIKVKLIWDSTTLPGAVIELLKEQAKELEFRISVRVDPKTTFK